MSEDKLTVRWSKRERALLYDGPKTSGGFVAHVFEGVPTHMGPTFAKELEARGYDLTTLRFSVSRRKP